MRWTMLILTLMLMLPGCTTGAASEDIRERDWTLSWIEGFDSMPSGVATPMIRFGADGHLSGNTGCNSAGAAFTTEGDQLRVQAMLMTKRACLEPEGNRLERAYAQAVERTRRFRVTNGELELLDDAGTVLARFREKS